MDKTRSTDKLRRWQERYRVAKAAYDEDLKAMDLREDYYAGKVRDCGTDPVTGEQRQTFRVRNVCAEMIESQIGVDVPMPKVTALDEKDEWLAQIIEDMLRDEVRRMHIGVQMDMMQRTVPIQGGGIWHIEWDNTLRTHATVGEIVMTGIHPKRLIPQPGVTGDLEEMDYFFLTVPQTKASIKARYNVDVSMEGEEEPEIRGTGDEDASDEMVTQIVAYHRRHGGSVGRFSWVGDKVLEDFDDYLARRLRVCARCGQEEPTEDVEPIDQTLDGTRPGGGPEVPEDMEMPGGRTRNAGGGRTVCPYCGGTKWEERELDYEEFWEPMTVPRPDGSFLMIPGAKAEEEEVFDEETGTPTMLPTGKRIPERVPYYRVNLYPAILQRNTSQFGTLLGSSDIDRLMEHQRELNHLEWKIHGKLSSGGSYMILPEKDATIEIDDRQMKIIRIGSAADRAKIGVETMEADITADMARVAEIYEQVKQTIGVTDSFLGRKDPSATSGKAKEFAAAQAAGRQQSKAVMRDAAWARLYQLMFQLRLAFADEPRPVVGSDGAGGKTYQEFNRYLFLRQDEYGEWYWNDRFLFETDSAAPLATNRDAMWEQMTEQYRTGAIGDPTSVDAQILYWAQMAQLHFPMASNICSALTEQRDRTVAALQQQMAALAQENEALKAAQSTMTNDQPLPGGSPVQV